MSISKPESKCLKSQRTKCLKRELREAKSAYQQYEAETDSMIVQGGAYDVNTIKQAFSLFGPTLLLTTERCGIFHLYQNAPVISDFVITGHTFTLLTISSYLQTTSDLLVSIGGIRLFKDLVAESNLIGFPTKPTTTVYQLTFKCYLQILNRIIRNVVRKYHDYTNWINCYDPTQVALFLFYVYFVQDSQGHVYQHLTDFDTSELGLIQKIECPNELCFTKKECRLATLRSKRDMYLDEYARLVKFFEYPNVWRSFFSIDISQANYAFFVITDPCHPNYSLSAQEGKAQPSSDYVMEPFYNFVNRIAQNILPSISPRYYASPPPTVNADIESILLSLGIDTASSNFYQMTTEAYIELMKCVIMKLLKLPTYVDPLAESCVEEYVYFFFRTDFNAKYLYAPIGGNPFTRYCDVKITIDHLGKKIITLSECNLRRQCEC